MRHASIVVTTMLLFVGDVHAQQPANQCQIEDWRYYEHGSSIKIEGTTTCPAGRLDLRAYGPNNEFIGSDFTYFEGYIFDMYIQNAQVPSSLSIKYSISIR